MQSGVLAYLHKMFDCFLWFQRFGFVNFIFYFGEISEFKFNSLAKKLEAIQLLN